MDEIFEESVQEQFIEITIESKINDMSVYELDMEIVSIEATRAQYKLNELLRGLFNQHIKQYD